MMEPDLTAALGAPVLSGRMRSRPEDFIVHERDAFAASGHGEHLLLRVQKRGMNTSHVVRLLADWAGIPPSAIGHAGMKDRHAVTTQRFSLWLPKRQMPALEALQQDDLQVLEQDWHSRKLARGALAGNRFELCLREVQGEPAAIEARLQQIARRGVPNAFGEQRFGHQGGNLDAARAMFAGRRVGREKRSLLLSAARSEVFNRILAERIRREAWDRALPGEVFVLDGSRSIFGPQALDERLIQRLAEGDIHPGGALWGAGELRSEDEVRAIEQAVADAEPELAAGLVAAGLKQERRALRVRPQNLQWHWPQAHTLQLGFSLPAGSYATAVLQALGTLQNAASPSDDSA